MLYCTPGTPFTSACLCLPLQFNPSLPNIPKGLHILSLPVEVQKSGSLISISRRPSPQVSEAGASGGPRTSAGRVSPLGRSGRKQRCGVDVDHLISRKKKLVKKQEQKLKRLKKLQKQTAASKDTSVSIEVNSSTRDMESNNMEDSKAEGEGSAMSCRDGGAHACPERKATDLPAVSTGNELEDMAASGQEGAKAPDVTTLKALGLPQPHFHSLVLDLGALSFVDTVCLKSLKNIFRDFREIEVEVYMAACHTPVVAQLEAGHFFDASITKQHLFASVHDAVLFALQHPRSSPASPVLMTKL